MSNIVFLTEYHIYSEFSTFLFAGFEFHVDLFVKLFK